MSRIEEIRKRLGEATKGPWEVDKQEHLARPWPAVVKTVNGKKVCTTHQQYPKGLRWYWEGSRPDADFIANAPTDIIYLLDEVDKLQSIIYAMDKEGLFKSATKRIKTMAEGT